MVFGRHLECIGGGREGGGVGVLTLGMYMGLNVLDQSLPTEENSFGMISVMPAKIRKMRTRDAFAPIAHVVFIVQVKYRVLPAISLTCESLAKR